MAGIGGTVADALNVMSLLDNELQVSSGERDETRAIRALTQAQHYLELLCATRPPSLQTATTIVTATDTETTSWATSLLRLDALWYLDSNGNPVRRVKKINEIGGHVPSLPWPFQVTLSAPSSGVPMGYYGNMDAFYWLPRPDGVYSIRLYGLIEQNEFAARTDDLNTPKRATLALATFAVKLLRLGVDDDVKDMDALAAQIFGPLLKQLTSFDRSEPIPRTYTEMHTT